MIFFKKVIKKLKKESLNNPVVLNPVENKMEIPKLQDSKKQNVNPEIYKEILEPNTEPNFDFILSILKEYPTEEEQNHFIEALKTAKTFLASCDIMRNPGVLENIKDTIDLRHYPISKSIVEYLQKVIVKNWEYFSTNSTDYINEKCFNQYLMTFQELASYAEQITDKMRLLRVFQVLMQKPIAMQKKQKEALVIIMSCEHDFQARYALFPWIDKDAINFGVAEIGSKIVSHAKQEYNADYAVRILTDLCALQGNVAVEGAKWAIQADTELMAVITYQKYTDYKSIEHKIDSEVMKLIMNLSTHDQRRAAAKVVTSRNVLYQDTLIDAITIISELEKDYQLKAACNILNNDTTSSFHISIKATSLLKESKEKFQADYIEKISTDEIALQYGTAIYGAKLINKTTNEMSARAIWILLTLEEFVRLNNVVEIMEYVVTAKDKNNIDYFLTIVINKITANYTEEEIDEMRRKYNIKPSYQEIKITINRLGTRPEPLGKHLKYNKLDGNSLLDIAKRILKNDLGINHISSSNPLNFEKNQIVNSSPNDLITMGESTEEHNQPAVLQRKNKLN